MNSTPKPILYIIVIAIAVLAMTGVLGLTFTMFYKTYADPSVLAAMISITSGCVGSLSTLLSNMRQPAVGTTTFTQTPSSVIIEPAKPVSPGEPAKVEVINPPENPVKTEEIKP